MSDFPDISSKLGAPVKKSIFERQKAEAEAKKAREQAETAAVLKEFEKSFDDDTSRSSHNTHRSGVVPSGLGRRHFTSSSMKSGPGSLGPASLPKSGPGSLGSSFHRKRQYDDYSDRRDRNDRGGVFSYSDERKTSFDHDRDEEEEKAAAKPTLHLSSIPPGTSPSVIKGLLAQSPVNVENVRILSPNAPTGSSTERRSVSAIVVLAADTPGADIDTVVSQLQNRYLGLGYNLAISRHLSSAVSSVNIATSGTNSLPFGAKPINQQTSLSRAPPPNQRFAPPSSYTSSTPYSKSSTQVTVQAPADLIELKLIHKTLEALLTYGPEFEALLMSRPEVQIDEKWAWLFNPRSAGGVYYRWRLWEILTDAKGRRKHGRYNPEPLFDGQSTWNPPDEGLRFEYATKIDEFVSDEDYNSSDEEDMDGGGGIANRYTDHNASGAAPEEIHESAGYLNPLAKTKLIHLLSRLPDSNSKLRKGDVARITAFAINHAGSGAEEVTTIITRNAIKPFNDNTEEDQTPGSLVGLYVVSDILSSSASAGVRHAWRYRTLFENAFKRQKLFEKLGRAERDLSWGKLKAEKWRRSIHSLFSLWEGWSVFPQASHESFVHAFDHPPLTERERAAAEAEVKRKVSEEASRKKMLNRWKSVDDEQQSADTSMLDVDGMAMNEDSDMEDVTDENIDGVPMDDSSDEDVPPPPPPDPEAEPDKVSLATKPQDLEKEKEKVKMKPVANLPPVGRRQRPRAADMFADDSS